MIEFETYTYLDMEKTGSSFVATLLHQFCTERELRWDQHRGMEAECDRDKFYFITVRQPLDAYLSLYSFGCTKGGKVHHALTRKGHGDFYDGTVESFNSWLRFVLKPRSAKALGDRYAAAGKGSVADLVGLQSFRYLRLTIPNGERLLADCKSEDDVRALYRDHNILNFTVRHESFREDLVTLLREHLSYAMNDLDGALAYVGNTAPVNPSKRVDAGEPDFTLSPPMRKKLQRREWFLNELLGY